MSILRSYGIASLLTKLAKTPLKSLISVGFSYKKVQILFLRLLLSVIAQATALIRDKVQ